MPPRRRSLDDLIAQTAPEEALRSSESAAHQPMGRKPTPIRSTMDLPPDEHADFLKWAVDASTAIGRSVNGQRVLRAMVRRLLVDPELAAQIRQDLADGRGAK